MSDLTPDTPDTPTTTSETGTVDQSRRKLTGAALGATAVFTLASRPVWANQCTISGMASGNLSAPKVTCEGCTPGYWKQCQHLDSWGPTGFKTTDEFNTIFGVTQYINPQNHKPFTLLEVFGLNGNGCTPDPTQPNCSLKPNGNAIGNMGCDPIFSTLGFHAVAALLNAAHPNINFGYSAGELIAFFKANYLTNPSGLKDSLAMLNQRVCPLN